MNETLEQRLQREARETFRSYRNPETNYIEIDDITAFHKLNSLIAHTLKETKADILATIQNLPSPDGEMVSIEDINNALTDA